MIDAKTGIAWVTERMARRYWRRTGMPMAHHFFYWQRGPKGRIVRGEQDKRGGGACLLREFGEENIETARARVHARAKVHGARKVAAKENATRGIDGNILPRLTLRVTEEFGPSIYSRSVEARD